MDSEGSGELRKNLVLTVILVCLFFVAVIAGCGGNGDAGGGEPNGAGSTGIEAGNGDAEAGEGDSEEPVEITDEGGKKITVEESQEEGGSGTITLEGEGGEQSTIEVQEQAPSEEALGAPIYPNSQYVEGSGVSGTSTQGDKKITATGAEFTTGDSASKVIGWYKTKLGEPMQSGPETATWMFKDSEEAVITVIIEPFEGKLKITIAKVSGDIGSLEDL
jgi:hypothetical protein